VSVRTETLLWLAQRLSAMLLGVFVLVHLVTILYAMHGGLTAQEILSRTQGNIGWAIFYVLFVLAIAVHAPIGLRNVLTEWLHVRGRAADVLLTTLAVILSVWGLRAVWAVFAQ